MSDAYERHERYTGVNWQALLTKLEEPAAAATIIDQLTALRAELSAPANMQLFVAGDMTKLSNPYADLAVATFPVGCQAYTLLCTGA